MSTSIRQRISRIQSIIERDPGKRGIARLCTADSVFSSAHRLMQEDTRSVAVITGFCIPPTETDGPLGAMAIVRSLLHVGKRVVLVTDEANRGAMGQLIRHTHAHGEVPLVVFPTPRGAAATTSTTTTCSSSSSSSSKNAGADLFELSEEDLLEARTLALSVLREHEIDHLVAIERIGPNEHNRCYTMRARDLTHMTGRTEALFDVLQEYARQRGSAVATTGIGDGGNEIGMGSRRDVVASDIANGGTIACRVATDHLIAAGVSNWGGYALAAAMYLLRSEQHRSAGLEHFLRPVDQERDLLRILVEECGATDGTTGKAEMMVDGFYFDDLHAGILQEIIDVALEEQ